MKRAKVKSKLKFVKPTVSEDRTINAGIRRDPDTYEISSKESAELRPVAGRTPAKVKKT